MTTDHTHIRATSRDAGRNVVHTVTDWHGDVIDTRRSAHSYSYAICRRVMRNDRASVVVVRWSKSNRCTGGQFAVRVERQP